MVKIVRDFLATIRILVFDHPSYSPVLAPCDFCPFPKLKMAMKGKCLYVILDIQKASITMQKALTIVTLL